MRVTDVLRSGGIVNRALKNGLRLSVILYFLEYILQLGPIQKVLAAAKNRLSKVLEESRESRQGNQFVGLQE